MAIDEQRDTNEAKPPSPAKAFPPPPPVPAPPVGELIQPPPPATQEEPRKCPICNEGENEKRAMRCINCKAMYHTNCFRKQFPKMTQSSSKGWYCPDCHHLIAREEQASFARKKKKKKVVKTKVKTKLKVTPKTQEKKIVKKSLYDGPTDDRFTRVVDAALRAGKAFNMLIMERTEDIIQKAHALALEVESYATGDAEKDGETQAPVKNEPPPSDKDIAAAMMPMYTPQEDLKEAPATSTSVVKEKPVALLKKLTRGLSGIQDALQQLQFASVQAEVDLIKEVKLPAVKPRKLMASHMNGAGTPQCQTKVDKQTSAVKSEKKKGSHCRLYTREQQQKLESWYQLSSRPEAPEINAMYKVINSSKFQADEQPNGIAIKQIRIWFDNRRAKERQDYMRAKLKAERTKDMTPEVIQQMKADYLVEAKEVLEARVTRHREVSDGAAQIIEEGRLVDEDPNEEVHIARALPVGTSSKKRLRLENLPSVKKAVKDARDDDKTEEEVAAIKQYAIDQVKQRIPRINLEANATVGLEDVTQMKMSLLKMVQNEDEPEIVGDLIDYVSSLSISHAILKESEFDRQLPLAHKAYKHIKWLARDITSLIDKCQRVTSVVKPSPQVVRKEETTPSSAKRTRVKFTIPQLKRLEKNYLDNATPSKKRLQKICVKLNASPLRDPTQPEIEFKQVRTWFYKRRAANEPPQALKTPSGALAGEEENRNDSSTESEGDDDDDDDDDEPNEPKLESPATEASASGMPATPPVHKSPFAKEREPKAGRIFSAKQIEFIRREYDIDPRPDAKSVDTMCEILNKPPYEDRVKCPEGVTRRQIMTWFSNRRAKERQDFVKQKVRAASAAGLTEAEIEKIREEADAEIKEVIDARTKPRSDRRGKYKRAKKVLTEPVAPAITAPTVTGGNEEASSSSSSGTSSGSGSDSDNDSIEDDDASKKSADELESIESAENPEETEDDDIMEEDGDDDNDLDLTPADAKKRKPEDKNTEESVKRARVEGADEP